MILPRNGKIQLAIVTGGHSFRVPPFYEVFRALPDVDFYPQALDEFTAYSDLAAAYDVVLFYNMHSFAPGDELPWYQAKCFATLEQLGRATQGIGVLHHGLVAFLHWPLWSELTGIPDRTQNKPHFEQAVPVQVVDANHPITRGVSDWTLHDETYEMASARPEDGNHPVLTTSHPHSMRPLAWTRIFRDGRVFCWQSGHDHRTFEDPNFRRVMHKCIHWLAGRDSPENGVRNNEP